MIISDLTPHSHPSQLLLSLTYGYQWSRNSLPVTFVRLLTSDQRVGQRVNHYERSGVARWENKKIGACAAAETSEFTCHSDTGNVLNVRSAMCQFFSLSLLYKELRLMQLRNCASVVAALNFPKGYMRKKF